MPILFRAHVCTGLLVAPLVAGCQLVDDRSVILPEANLSVPEGFRLVVALLERVRAIVP